MALMMTMGALPAAASRFRKARPQAVLCKVTMAGM